MKNFPKFKFLNNCNNLYDVIKYHHYFCKILGISAHSIVIQMKTKQLVLLKRDYVFVLWQIFNICFTAINYTTFLIDYDQDELWMFRGFQKTNFDVILYYVIFAILVMVQSIIMLYFYFSRGRISYILNRSDELDNMMLRIKIRTDYNSSFKFCLIQNLYFFTYFLILNLLHYLIVENYLFITINYFLTNCIINGIICYITTFFHNTTNKFKAMNQYFVLKYSSNLPHKIENTRVVDLSRNLVQELPIFLLIYKELNMYAKYVKDTFSVIISFIVVCSFLLLVSTMYYSIVSMIHKNHWNEMKYVIIIGHGWNLSHVFKVNWLLRNLIESTFEVSEIQYSFVKNTTNYQIRKMDSQYLSFNHDGIYEY